MKQDYATSRQCLFIFNAQEHNPPSFTSGCSNLIRNIKFHQVSPLKEPEQKIARNSQKWGLCYTIECFDQIYIPPFIQEIKAVQSILTSSSFTHTNNSMVRLSRKKRTRITWLCKCLWLSRNQNLRFPPSNPILASALQQLSFILAIQSYIQSSHHVASPDFPSYLK